MSVSTQVILARLDMYYDFSINLANYIIYYYLDPETLNHDNDIRNHFDFCFNKTCDDFIKEDINFKGNRNLKEYLYTYYYNQFYTKTTTQTLTSILDFWDKIFNFKDKKYNNVLLEVYNIFDETLKRTLILNT